MKHVYKPARQPVLLGAYLFTMQWFKGQVIGQLPQTFRPGMMAQVPTGEEGQVWEGSRLWILHSV